jgi:hypothetical protein
LSFTETTAAIPPRSRLTLRLRDQLATAIAGSNRAVAEARAAHWVSWDIAHDALVTAAARWLPCPPPTRVLGIDETRAQRVRCLLEPTGWRSDPIPVSISATPTRGHLTQIDAHPSVCALCPNRGDWHSSWRWRIPA